MAAQAQTETLFGPEPEKPDLTPLPNLMKTLPPEGINVHVPVYVPYTVFEKPFSKAIKIGEYQQVTLEDGTLTEARFNSLEIFGTDEGRIATGLDVSIKSPLPFSDIVGGKIGRGAPRKATAR